MKTPAAMNPEQIERLAAAERVENERAIFWPLIPMPARQVVMMAARLPRERAGDALASFTAIERRQIALAASMLEQHIRMAEQCMADTTGQTTILPGHLH